MHAAATAAAADDLRLPLPSNDPSGGALLQTQAWGALIPPVTPSGTPRKAEGARGGSPSRCSQRTASSADMTPRGMFSSLSFTSPRSTHRSTPAGQREWRHGGRAPAFGGGGGQYAPVRQLGEKEREVVSTLTVVSGMHGIVDTFLPHACLVVDSMRISAHRLMLMQLFNSPTYSRCPVLALLLQWSLRRHSSIQDAQAPSG